MFEHFEACHDIVGASFNELNGDIMGTRKTNFSLKVIKGNASLFEEIERLRDEIYPVWSPASEPEPGTIEEHVGAVIVATGFDLYPVESVTEYGGGEISDVVSSFDFEHLLAAANGKLEVVTWLKGKGAKLKSLNPATGELIAQISACNAKDVDMAVDKAESKEVQERTPGLN